MGSLISYFRDALGMSDYGDMTQAEIAMAQQKDIMEHSALNSASWQVEGYKKAGLNPVLAATGGLQPSNSGQVSMGQTGQTTANTITSAAKLASVIAGIATKNPKLIAAATAPKHYTNNYYNNTFTKQK